MPLWHNLLRVSALPANPTEPLLSSENPQTTFPVFAPEEATKLAQEFIARVKADAKSVGASGLVVSVKFDAGDRWNGSAGGYGTAEVVAVCTEALDDALVQLASEVSQ